MTQATPTQELAAKDLHGFEWKFKHIYRGNLVSILGSSLSDFSCLFKFEWGMLGT